jgi:excisionase family DNA binding protein
MYAEIRATDPILDDDGLRRLLKLPEGADLGHYRDHEALPYLQFRQGDQVFHRYITSEVLQWLVQRQRNSLNGTIQADPSESEKAASSEAGEDGNSSNRPYLTVTDAAKLLNVGDDTIERMIKRGDLPVVEISGRGELGSRRLKRIRRESLDALMKQKERTEYSPVRRRRKRDTTPDFIGDD